MNRSELHPLINIEYSPDTGYGVKKVSHPDYQNIWYVIPPSIQQMRDLGSKSLRESDRLTRALTKGHRALNELRPVEDLDGIDRLIAKLLYKSEALASSRMEGTYSTINEVYSPSDQDTTAETRSVVGYAQALEKLYNDLHKSKHDAVSLELFKNIHRAIAKHDPSYEGEAGVFRSQDTKDEIVHIGGGFRRENSIYNPAPPTVVGSLMKNFVAWLSDRDIQEEADAGITAKFTLPIRMAFAHAHFEAIHPFRDGNGRVGRCIWPIQMILSGYSPIYLSGYVEAEKSQYMAALASFQKQLDVLPMVEFICDALAESLKETETTKKALLELPEKWRSNNFRKGSAAYRLLDLLLENPIVTSTLVSEQLKVSEPAALRAIDQLEESKVLKETTGFKRNRKYSAVQVLEIISRPFGSDL